ncbi:hypothetical protein [Streptomyces olivoreticuli]|uniref:hypothetical protein n=1 Tax=Streptomyces olivoreticuli TaxID=68246 RepID=UPI0013C33EC9|nr:hypothetical protein [Streptomyces olivoreticuli]
MWSLLTLYQTLRTVMVEAAESRPGIDPDRCGFTIAIQTARDLVNPGRRRHQARRPGRRHHRRHRQPDPGRAPPAPAPRISTRKVRSSVSRYTEHQDDGRPDISRLVTGLDVTILEPDPDLPTVSYDDWYTPPADRRRQRVLDLLHADPDRQWHTRDLARHLGDITLSTMYRQLDRWAAHGLITKTRPATCSSPRTPPTPLPPAEIC